MDVLDAIQGRRSIRAFLDQPVSKALIEKLLGVARWAPSGVNAQPWHVAVLGKSAMKRIGDDIIEARENNIPENPDYAYYPREWFEPYKSRRKACGLALYSALNIQKDDHVRRKAQWYKNYHFFNAPCGFIFMIDKSLDTGSWMDTGMFIQNVMLAARGLDLETCPQASLAEYPDIVRKHCNIEDRFLIVCGMAVGYADYADPVNQYRTEREAIETFCRWID